MQTLIIGLVLLFAAPAWAQTVPNYRADVEACVSRYPAAWACAHTGRSCSADFVILCARDINRAKDARVGVNGKRGNPNDLSQDIIAYRGIGTAIDVTRGNTPMEIIDVIVCAGGDPPRCEPSVDWGVAPGGPGDRGAWVDPWSVQPTAGGTPTPTPTPAPTPAPTVDLRPALDAIAALAQQVGALGESVRVLADEVSGTRDAVAAQTRAVEALAARPVTVEWPEYRGRVLGMGVTLRPAVP